MNSRYAAIAIVGAVLFVFYFQPFLPYSQRSQFSSHWWPFPVIALIFSFLLSLYLTHRRFWVPTCLLLTLFAANAILIVVDFMIGAVDHNLFSHRVLVHCSPGVACLFGSVTRGRR